MCEERERKFRKNCRVKRLWEARLREVRLREARFRESRIREARLQEARLRETRRREAGLAHYLPHLRESSTRSNEDPFITPMPTQGTFALQEFIYRDLSMRTAELVQKSQEIQKKISDLKKETAQFVASAIYNPADKRLQLLQLEFYKSVCAFEARANAQNAQPPNTQQQQTLQQKMEIQSDPVVKEEPLSPKT